MLEYVFLSNDGDCDIEARLDGVRVGHVWGSGDGSRLQLSDIRVEEWAPQRRSLLQRFFQSHLPPARLRGAGIGSELLRRFLAKADSTGIKEIWGSVREEDLRNWPSLLDWYMRHGFAVVEPDAECIDTAAKKIVRRAP